MMCGAGERRQAWGIRRRSTRPSSSRGRFSRAASAAAPTEIGRELGVDPGSVSDWAKRADASAASPEDNPFRAAEENRRLRREVERPRRENEILLKASAFFASRQL